MIYLYKIWHDDAKCLSSALPIKNVILKIQDVIALLERPVLHHHEILHFLILKTTTSRLIIL